MSSWETNIRRVVPYVPGEQPKETDVIKLNTNENPYPPAKGVMEALKNVNADALRKYPDPAAEVLVSAIARRMGLGKDQVFVGVGSDDVWADVFRIPYECQPLNDRFEIEPEDYRKENGGIIFPNPNAPTGVLMPLEQVEAIIAANPDVVVVVDEAYIDFGGVSTIPMIEKYENLLVVQTFSKSRSLAGMRIGYACGSPKLIKYLNDVKYSFNSYTMDAATLAAGTASVLDEAYFQETRQKIINTRERVKGELRELGFVFADSQANFLFASHKDCPAKELFEALKKENIYVRYFNKPRIDQYLRITIGTDEQMDRLLEFLKNYLAERKQG